MYIKDSWWHRMIPIRFTSMNGMQTTPDCQSSVWTHVVRIGAFYPASARWFCTSYSVSSYPLYAQPSPSESSLCRIRPRSPFRCRTWVKFALYPPCFIYSDVRRDRHCISPNETRMICPKYIVLRYPGARMTPKVRSERSQYSLPFRELESTRRPISKD